MPHSEKQFRIVASARMLGNRRGEVTVYSAIYPYSYGSDDPTVTSNKFLKELNSLEDVDEIVVRINSPGGVITEAIAIRTALMKHPAKKVIDIEGCCDSAASLIACMPGARVRMAKGGEYMVHRCTGGARGNADKMLSAYNSMMATDKEMAAIYAERTGKSEDECYALMKAETWYGSKEALEAGFVDEIITGADDDIVLAACAVDAETMALMKSCYTHTPDRPIREKEADADKGAEDVSNGNTAVAAVNPTENKNEGVNTMDELKNATAEQITQENPEAAEAIRKQAIEDERKRTEKIDALTPPGAEYAKMAQEAKADGTSVSDYLEAVIAKQREASRSYLEHRKTETKTADKVGGGDSGDHDGDSKEAKQEKMAEELAALADDMEVDAKSAKSMF